MKIEDACALIHGTSAKRVFAPRPGTPISHSMDVYKAGGSLRKYTKL